MIINILLAKNCEHLFRFFSISICMLGLTDEVAGIFETKRSLGITSLSSATYIPHKTYEYNNVALMY